MVGFLLCYLLSDKLISRSSGQICDKDGAPIPEGTPPTPRESDKGPDDWTPYDNRVQFEVADFLFRRNQMSAGDINFMTGLWAASLAPHNDSPPFANANAMYDTIDSTPLGDVPWQSFTLNYNGDVPNDRPNDETPPWMTADYDVWFRDPRILVQNMISNPEFDGEFDYAPYHEYSADNQHRFEDFMSGNWAWKQAVGYS